MRRSTLAPSRVPWGVASSRPCSWDRTATSCSFNVAKRKPQALPFTIHHCVCGSVGWAAKTGLNRSSAGSMYSQVRSVSTRWASESITPQVILVLLDRTDDPDLVPSRGGGLGAERGILRALRPKFLYPRRGAG